MSKSNRNSLWITRFHYFESSRKSLLSEGRKERKKGKWIHLTAQRFYPHSRQNQVPNRYHKSLCLPVYLRRGVHSRVTPSHGNMLRHCFISDSEGGLTHKYHFTTEPFTEKSHGRNQVKCEAAWRKRSDELMAQGRMAADVWEAKTVERGQGRNDSWVVRDFKAKQNP